MLAHGQVNPTTPDSDRAFGLPLQDTHAKMQAIVRGTERGLRRIRVLLELAGRWANPREVSLDDQGLHALTDSLEDQRRIKTITYRLWRAHARTPEFTKNLLAQRELIVGEDAIRRRLMQMRGTASRMRKGYDAALAGASPADPVAPVDRINPWRLGGDLMAVLASSALAYFDVGGIIHHFGAGQYLWAAAHAGALWFVAKPIWRAKIESLYWLGRQWWQNRGGGVEVTSLAQASTAQLDHVNRVLGMLKSKSKSTFAYFGASVDLDLRRSDAPAHPFRRTAPTSAEILAATTARAGAAPPLDPRRLEVDCVFRYDEVLKNFVYAIHAWEPAYSTETRLWGW